MFCSQRTFWTEKMKRLAYLKVKYYMPDQVRELFYSATQKTVIVKCLV